MTKKQKQELERQKEDIVMSLPGFINQLLLLLDSGQTLDDAFRNIAAEYVRFPERERNCFTDKIAVIVREADRSGTGPVNGFYRFAMSTNVRELTKAANYLYENKNRGTDLWESLSALAEDLWEERKRLCLVRIRKAELKMSFPLAIMLISLIIMTSAPALMQIS